MVKRDDVLKDLSVAEMKRRLKAYKKYACPPTSKMKRREIVNFILFLGLQDKDSDDIENHFKQIKKDVAFSIKKQQQNTRRKDLAEQMKMLEPDFDFEKEHGVIGKGLEVKGGKEQIKKKINKIDKRISEGGDEGQIRELKRMKKNLEKKYIKINILNPKKKEPIEKKDKDIQPAFNPNLSVDELLNIVGAKGDKILSKGVPEMDEFTKLLGKPGKGSRASKEIKARKKKPKKGDTVSKVDVLVKKLVGGYDLSLDKEQEKMFESIFGPKATKKVKKKAKPKKAKKPKKIDFKKLYSDEYKQRVKEHNKQVKHFSKEEVELFTDMLMKAKTKEHKRISNELGIPFSSKEFKERGYK